MSKCCRRGLLHVVRGHEYHKLPAVPGMPRIEPLQHLAVALVVQQTADQKGPIIPEIGGVLARFHSSATLETDLRLHT